MKIKKSVIEYVTKEHTDCTHVEMHDGEEELSSIGKQMTLSLRATFSLNNYNTGENAANITARNSAAGRRVCSKQYGKYSVALLADRQQNTFRVPRA